MPISASSIQKSLRLVQAEHERRDRLPSLATKVLAIKAYQQRRFAHTYADMLASARYGGASRFFLEQLYGPGDFRNRDRQFGRVVPTLSRVFPQDIVGTVAMLAELHALSEQLDSEMGNALTDEPITALAYCTAWQVTGRRVKRETQIALTVKIASNLEHITKSKWIRGSLRLMRSSAHAAGLGELQSFLESGFDAFKAMNGAMGFISAISERERRLASALFDRAAHLPRVDGLSREISLLLPSDTE